MMAEVLPYKHGQMDMGNLERPQYWAPPDERDAYIGWLKSEFAAANALIDSMCHHMRSIGGPGEYDLVFGCLNRRRHAWTPSLYMQHFFSVAEVVSALQEVAWKKHHTSSNANAAPKDCPLTGAQAEEAHDIKAQLGSNQRSNTRLNLTANSVVKSQQNAQVRIECFSTSNKYVNGSHVKATPETGEVEISTRALSTSAESSSITECDKKTSRIVQEPSSTSHICNSGEQVISANNTEGLDVKKLLNTEVSIASKEEGARQAMIKRSMQFQCCEHVDGQKINDGESVELCESVFNSKEVDEIIEIICQLQAAGRQGELGCAFRGCKKSSRLPEIIQFGPKLDDSQCIPKFLQAIIRWLTSCGILSPKRWPDSFLISIFDEMEELEDDAASIWKRIKQCAEADPEFVTWLKKTIADNDGGDPQTVHHKPMSSSVLESLQEKVHQLMDDSDCIGSFLCVGPSTGICTMHQVLRGSMILQDTLSVSGHQVVHVVSYPYYDFSIYSVLLKDDEPPLQYFDFESNSMIAVGMDVFLAGYPRLDSQEEENILVTHGMINCTALRADSPVALAQYPAFANSSGGAVVSSRGRLVGIHLEIYHTEYHDYYRGPPSPFDDPEISDSCEVRSLQWEEFRLHDDPDVKLAGTDVKDLARHAVCNMGEKGMLGGFLPVNYLRLKLKNEGIILKQSTKTKRRRKA